MSLLERAPVIVSFVLLAALLAGLFVRRLYRVCYSFPAWLLAVLAGDVLVFFWTQRFYTWAFWMTKETVYAVLKLAIAVEITALAFQAFPSARATVRRVMLGVLLALLAFVLVGVRYQADLPDLARELQRRTANGVALVFCATWAVVLYYRLPLHRLHRAILRGLVPYLLVFAAASTLTLVFGWDVRRNVNMAEAAAWDLMLAYWCWEVWRRPPGDDSRFMRQLQPWRARI
jgi:hypothetical protein